MRITDAFKVEGALSLVFMGVGRKYVTPGGRIRTSF